MIENFFTTMAKDPFADLLHHSHIAIGVSGGPDSMALAYLFSRWTEEQNGPHIHVLSVDHGLRPEAVAEVEHVRQMSESWPKTAHYILKWEGEKPAQRVQESARAARYDLMAAHCKSHDIGALALAHHRDDQAETVLFRLAKGSGLDGLAGMRQVQKRGGLDLFRPLLDVSKEDILALCAVENIAYIEDPSNEKKRYARVRLRQSREVLEREGISSKRLAMTAKRMDRARCALDYFAGEAYRDSILNKNSKHIVFNFILLSVQPEEIVLRVLLLAMEALHPSGDYRPRMEKIEALVADLLEQDSMKPRTLGGVIFSRKGAELVLALENVK